MQIFTTRKALRDYLNSLENKHLSLGFVPTMGALHAGHISLLEQARKQCDLTVCSIFVNPRQFNDPEDLKRYPRTPEKDIAMLSQSGCDVLFLPDVDEIYPELATESYSFGLLDKILEAAHRPGHFNGVAQVLSRFFTILQANKAFFGEKDYQQLLVVKALIRQMGIKTQVVPCPIVRETDGLAMSSRNALLSSEERALAAHIPMWMKSASELASSETIEDIKIWVKQKTEQHPKIKLDYFEICDPNTLEPFSGRLNERKAIALIALYTGKIRLIDNIPVLSKA
ncbi:MAG: pantoate--beta-alanine ligase [Bacteroidia bacterium]|jgi:pantoate--beta-alanine ligase|nr:pantoate--beta-alanine ligase [Bacteroidia bacterium]